MTSPARDSLSQWMGDLLADLEEGSEPDLPALEDAAQKLKERSTREAPGEGQPPAAMAELLAEAAEFIGAYVKTRDLDQLRQGFYRAQELCDLRESLQPEGESESF